MNIRSIGLAGILACAPGAWAATISSGDFSVELDPAFPGVQSVALGGETMKLGGNALPVVLINGTAQTPAATLAPVSGDTAEYQLTFKDLSVTMTVRFTVQASALEITIRDIRETGTFVVRTIEIPGLTLLAGAGADGVALGNFPGASYASDKAEDRDFITTVSALTFADNADQKAKDKNRDAHGNRGASYAFVSNGRLAAGVYSNVMQENLRMIATPRGEGAHRTLTVAPGMWTWREVPHETVEEPRALLVVSKDRNGDGQVTWQDAALAYRENAPRPYGAEITPRYPITHIALNFASQGTFPFLRILDNAKKVWLYTDGLGQRIQYKGYQAEGHDSSHPDYGGNVGRKMGGRDELNFAMRRGHDFNVLAGVHINAHEYHAEAKNFRPDLVDTNAVGWAWLDESYLTDYRYDSAYGTLYARLDAMRQDLPWLDFVYLDVYFGRGWPGWRMHRKVNSLGLFQCTEFPGVMERAVVWNHVANDWTQAIGGKGDRSEIARFIYYSQKDTFLHEPLLRGANCDGFMGWHAERSILQTIESAFTVNLPTKYLQHFELLRTDGNNAWFNWGARTEVIPDAATTSVVARIWGPDGQLINSCRYPGPNTRPAENLSFIPWDPCSEAKIYHWNDAGGTTTWTLPRSWSGVTVAKLYRLTDLGRVFERDIPVADGKVTLEGIQPKTPYVLYRTTPPPLPRIEWGEGGLVRDPGFDSHSFEAWKPSNPAAVAIENHAETGQTELVFGTPKAGEVRQTLSGLKPGQRYAASAWVSIDGTREAAIAVESCARPAAAFIDRGAWQIIKSTPYEGGNRARRMLDNEPKTFWQTQVKDKPAPFPHEFVLDFGQPLHITGFVQTCPADRTNGVIRAYRVMTSVNGQRWSEAAKGEFAYDKERRAFVTLDQPVTARYLRLVSLSTFDNVPSSAIAEFDVHALPETARVSPMAPVIRSVDRTSLTNFTDQSSKYMRNWHRMRVHFTAPADGRADLILRAGPGTVDAIVRFDDARVVENTESQPPRGARNVVLFEDFENVDEGWGPFMYGWKGPMNTHLSESNPPYTRDTIEGKYSLKSRQEDSPDMLYRTVPATLKLKPNTAYRVRFDYLCDTARFAAFVARSEDAKEGGAIFQEPIPDGSWQVRHFDVEFKTDARGDWFVGITKLEEKNKGTLVIDNVLIEEVGR